MTTNNVFSKLLDLKEREKKNAQKAYHRSMENFEDVAMNLYTLLKKKEDAEQAYDTSLQGNMTIEEIRRQNRYINTLTKQIAAVQYDVQMARQDMETKQTQLTDAYVEVKKYEKIIEYREEDRKQKLKKTELQTMDDISIRQYLATR
ncbi:MAG TPA: flagellar export protein FliJ [Cerasibacillus sp.]|uniref:flagellar export protein FliJ n=1 Tax=Cerasibacillus sp. TaxID=2498711 RepID=UPI002F422981